MNAISLVTHSAARPLPLTSSRLAEEPADRFEPGFLTPRSVVVVGGTDKPGKPGGTILKNLLDSFEGETFVVNRRGGTIMGKPAYTSISDLPQGVDMAVITIPGEFVEDALRECGEKGIKNAVIISAGFGETSDGASKSEQLAETARAHGVRVMGPNCLGLINTQVGLNASFAITPAVPGTVALLSQSGGVLISLMGVAEDKGFGFSTLASLGNKLDLQESDFLKMLSQDGATKVVAVYTEGLKDGRTFMRAAEETGKELPVLMLKGGRSASGARAASSHTGSLAGQTNVFDAAMEQAGVLVVHDEEELADLAMAFAEQPLPAGRRLAVVTNGGGPGIIATDNATERFGLEMAQLSSPETLAETLAELGAPHAGIGNPVDIVGDAGADRYRAALEAVLKDPGVDMGLVVLVAAGPSEMEETARLVAEVAREVGKPVAASFMGGTSTEAAQKILRDEKIPVYPVPTRAVRALGAMAEYACREVVPDGASALPEPDRAAAAAILERARAAGREKLNAQDCIELLEAYRIPVVGSRLAGSVEQAVAHSRELGFPVVMKVASEDVVHKKDIGGVILNIKNEEEARSAYTRIVNNLGLHKPGARLDGVQVMQMAPSGGREIIAGLVYDDTFGSTLMTGLGGSYVEVFKDVKFGVSPVSPERARKMLDSLAASKLLAGARGESPSDVEELSQVLARVSELGADFPEIGELDVNPLFVYEKGVLAVDARVTLRSTPSRQPAP